MTTAKLKKIEQQKEHRQMCLKQCIEMLNEIGIEVVKIEDEKYSRVELVTTPRQHVIVVFTRTNEPVYYFKNTIEDYSDLDAFKKMLIKNYKHENIQG